MKNIDLDKIYKLQLNFYSKYKHYAKTKCRLFITTYILSEFKNYEGTISNFCKENNISKQQFYYKRKKSNMINKPVFHAIDFTKKENLKNNSQNVYIRINV